MKAAAGVLALEIRTIMIKNRLLGSFLIAAACTCLAMAQNSEIHSSPARSADPLQVATQPLIRKSAPTVPHKSSVVPNQKPVDAWKMDAELTRLERQNVTAKVSKNGSTSAPKNTLASKSADASAGSGSAIDFKYQKPVGGIEATSPRAHAANSITPRVTKNN